MTEDLVGMRITVAAEYGTNSTTSARTAKLEAIIVQAKAAAKTNAEHAAWEAQEHAVTALTLTATA